MVGTIKKKAASRVPSVRKNAVTPSRRAVPIASGRRATARFDTRLPQEVKELLERAAQIRGFRSLSEFIVHYSTEAAHAILDKHSQVLASEKDRRVFFDALMQPPAPNAALVKAAKRYKAQARRK
jgi:uncharacterized protein (DUF1778 family)